MKIKILKNEGFRTGLTAFPGNHDVEGDNDRERASGAPSFVVEERNKLSMHFEEWYDEVKKSLAADGFDPKSNKKKALRCYNDGYTPDEFEEEWLALNGLLQEKLMLKPGPDGWDLFGELVTRAYEQAPSYDPEAAKSFKALEPFVEKMFKQISSRVNIEFVDDDPYPSDKEMCRDVQRNRRLKIWNGGTKHPIFSRELNVKLRAVHDYMAHCQRSKDFSLQGEIAAYNAHIKTIPREAYPALFTENVGQAAHFIKRGFFPEQKIAFLPGFDYVNVGKVDPAIWGYELDPKNKLLVKTSIKESLEDTGDLPIKTQLPNKVKKLVFNVQKLNKASQKAYEDGDLETAEELDSQFAIEKEKLEAAMDEIGYEGESKTGDELENPDWSGKSGTMGEDELMRQFADLYHRFINNLEYDLETKQDLIDRAKLYAKDYGWSMGGYKEETSDEQIFDAVVDSYERYKKLKRLNENRITPKSRKIAFNAINESKFAKALANDLDYLESRIDDIIALIKKLHPMKEDTEIREEIQDYLKRTTYMEPDGLQAEGNFQNKVKKGHSKMKFRVIGKGGNKHKSAAYSKKPSYKRSKSAPPGFGAIGEATKEYELELLSLEAINIIKLLESNDSVSDDDNNVNYFMINLLKRLKTPSRLKKNLNYVKENLTNIPESLKAFRDKLDNVKLIVYENKDLLLEKKSVFTMQIKIKSEQNTKLYGRIFEAIRGIEGITVIRATESIKRDGQGNKILNLYVRFYVNSAVVIPYIERLKTTIKSLKDADGDSIISVEIISLPEKQDTAYT